MSEPVTKFRSIIRLHKINPYVLVPADRAERLKAGWKKPMPVLVQLNGKPNPLRRISMTPVGDGNFRLYLHGTVRKTSATRVGDHVEISASFDKGYRGGPVHEMPLEFVEPLSSELEARAAWNKLPPSRKKEVLRYFAALKSDEAKTRNIEKAIGILSGSRECFLARDWNTVGPVYSSRARVQAEG